ncbi:bifunctional metallophosphatase/5'-nucleotidase [Peribacillus frigoritolerans]|uniref:5'-nucleotidase C-terminal domain-containing protein n=1 Tax=Peribacillus castrilensis TaxID=2897690 RepID=A0AAW9NH13_9BACI|nr:5'-nucleotidase C-terminal domain-containing protein [Peribacillus castrilensis]
MWKRTIVASLLAFQFTLFSVYADEPSQNQQAENQEYIDFQMLAINDFHGNLDTKSTLEGKEVGGAAYLATHLNDHQKDMESQAQKEGRKSYTLRLHAGDAVGASPSLSSLLQDEPTMKAINKMGFKLGVLGNHEFDEGIPEFKRLISASSIHPNVEKFTYGMNYEYHGIDKDFKYLAANVVDKASGQPIFDPYTVKDIGGVKVGFIGIVTTETKTSVIPTSTEPFHFLDEAATINEYAKELTGQGVKAIVVVAHEGAATSNGDTTGVMANVAKKIDDEVDIIFAAHSHEYANGVVDGKVIIQDYNYGQAFGDVRTELDPETKDFVTNSIKAEVVLNTRNVHPDTEVQAIVDEAKNITEKAALVSIGQTASSEPIGQRKPEDGENALGNLITDGQRTMVQGADFAITNSGGIREALIPKTNDKGEHIITWGAAYAVQPFNNYIQLIELTGQQIKDGLNQQWQNPEHIMFLQISGFKYTYVDGSKVPNCKNKYCVQNVFLEDGKTKMDMNKTYKVAMNEFLTSGGDGFSAFAKNKLVRNEGTDTELFISYIEKLASEGKKVGAKVEGRYKNGEDRTKPTTTATLVGTTGNNGWYTSNVTVKLNASDDESGVNKTQYRVNKGEWKDYTDPITLSTEGNNTFEYQSEDKFGNVEDTQTMDISIDKTAPVLKVTIDKPLLSHPNHKLVNIKVTLDSSDSISRIDSILLEPITVNEANATSDDIQGANYGTMCTEFSLRSERNGFGNGRIYTITYLAKDKAGNTVKSTETVTVPKGNQRKN